METLELQNATPVSAQFEPMVIPGLGTIQPRIMTIASVHFEPRNRPDIHHSRHLNLNLPAAPKGKYVTCSFCDSQQAVRNTGDPDQSVATYIPMPVPVDVIAASLIDAWGRAGVDAWGKARPRPGIILLKGKEPTADEMKQMIGLETALCRVAVEEGDRIEKTGKGEILDFHRNALSWLDSEKRNWFKVIERGKTKTSAVTGNQINMNATVDEGTDLIEYYVKYNLNPADYGDDHIAGLFKRDGGLKDRTATRLGLRNNQQGGK